MDADHARRVADVGAILSLDPSLDPKVADEVVVAIDETLFRADPGESRRRPNGIIGRVLSAFDLPDDQETADRIRHAMCIELGSRGESFPGALALLRGLRELDLRCVILSNTTFRGREEYGRDFEALGWAPFIDDVITSIDIGFAKPDAEMFVEGLLAAGCSADECLIIGDSETADIEPAVALGMPAIRVAIEEPLPASTCADALADSLAGALRIVKVWARNGNSV